MLRVKGSDTLCPVGPVLVSDWNFRGKQIRNGALVALDYQTGELIAYVGSANYYAPKSNKRFQAKYDVVGSGWWLMTLGMIGFFGALRISPG